MLVYDVTSYGAIVAHEGEGLTLFRMRPRAMEAPGERLLGLTVEGAAIPGTHAFRCHGGPVPDETADEILFPESAAAIR